MFGAWAYFPIKNKKDGLVISKKEIKYAIALMTYTFLEW